MDAIVWIIIAVAAVYIIRRYVGIIKGAGGCCGTGDTGEGAARSGRTHLSDFPRPAGRTRHMKK